MLRKLLLLSVLALMLTSRAQAQLIPAIQKNEPRKIIVQGKTPVLIASNGQEIPSWDAYLKTPDPVTSGLPATPYNERVLQISPPVPVPPNQTNAAPGVQYPVLSQNSAVVPVPGHPVPAHPVSAHPAPVYVPGGPGCCPKTSCGHRCNWKRIWEWMTYCAPRNGYLCGGCHTCAPSCTPPLFMYFLPCHSGCRPQCPPRPPLVGPSCVP